MGRGAQWKRAGPGRGCFQVPVTPGIAMSLGRKIMSGVPSIIFKSHLHGLKRNLKTPSPRPRPFPLRPAPHRTLSLSAAGRLCSEEGMEGGFGAVEMSAEGKMGKEKPEVWASGKNWDEFFLGIGAKDYRGAFLGAWGGRMAARRSCFLIWSPRA